MLRPILTTAAAPAVLAPAASAGTVGQWTRVSDAAPFVGELRAPTQIGRPQSDGMNRAIWVMHERARSAQSVAYKASTSDALAFRTPPL